jgi:translation initiation factor 1
MATKGGWREFNRPESTARSAASVPATPKGQQRVRVQRTKAGTGGSLKDGVIELQGDQVTAAPAALEQAGFRPKQAGG